jgi:DNA-binding CsgD family transcriptional regulator
LAGIDPDAARIISVLGVAGRALTEAELISATGQDSTAVRRFLRTLITARLVRAGQTNDFAPSHALLAEVIVTDLLPAERAEVHAAVAAALIQRDEPRLAAEVASHWLSAGRQPEELPARILAAEYAESVCAFAEAAQHWERALTIAAALDREAAGRIALRGMIAWENAGDEGRGAVLGQRGLEALADYDQPDIEADLRARTAVLTFPVDKDRALAELTSAINAFAALPASPSEIHALIWLYHMHVAQGTKPDGIQQLHRAVDRGSNLPAAAGDLVQAQTSLAYEQILTGDLSSARLTLAQARAAADATSDPYAKTWVALADSNARLALNHLDELVKLGLRDLDLIRSRGLGASFGARLVTANVVEAMLCLGQVDTAGTLIDPVTDDQPVRLDTRALHIQRCTVDLARGEMTKVAARVEDVVEVAPEPGLETAAKIGQLRAEFALWNGDPASAVDIVRQPLKRLVGTDEEWLTTKLLVLGMRARADLAADAAARQDPAAAGNVAALHEELLDMVSSMRSDVFAEHAFFVTAAAEGALFRAEHERCLVHSAIDAWLAAALAWEDLGHPHRAAYSRWRHAEALLTHGQRADAADTLTLAWLSADQHSPLRAQISSLAHLARIELSGRAELRPEPASDAGRPFGLTEREVDVLTLLVDGLTNAEIGARLYMSPKTASVHVSAILRKLHATNRVHAAAIAQRLGLTDPTGS